MKAITYDRYGPADAPRLRKSDIPTVDDDSILIRVRAASVKPADWHYMTGKPFVMRAVTGLLRPKHAGLGADLAGDVEAVGRNVTQFTRVKRYSAKSPTLAHSPSTSALPKLSWLPSHPT